jgi:hypothetical protein
MKKFLLTIIILIFAGAGLSFAVNKQIEFSASVSKDEVHIGDRIELDVKAKNFGKSDLLFQETPDAGEFSLISSSPVKAGWPSKKTIGRVYIMSIYTTGTHVIPPVSVQYKEKDADEWTTGRTPQVPINVLSLLTGEEKDIKDIKGLAGLRFDGSKVLLVLLILIAGAAVIVFLWIRRRRLIEEERLKSRAAHIIAYEELTELKEEHLPDKGLVKEYYSRLSDIARHYLENRFLYRAPEMTTEEFLTSIKSAKDLDSEQKELLKNFLSHCDMVKFAKYGPTPIEVLDSYNSTEDLVDQTKKEEELEEGGKK